MGQERPIKVAVIGGGCASMAAAFELTRPEHKGRYRLTVYQMGWRLGGKGASGRGPAGRIEEHGLHIWLGYYENAFKLLRECYAELGAGPRGRRYENWRDAFFPDPQIAISEQRRGGDGWTHLTAHFPPADGQPGDPPTTDMLSLRNYIIRSAVLLRTLLVGIETISPWDRNGREIARLDALASPEAIVEKATFLLRYGFLATAAAAVEALAVVEAALKMVPKLPAGVVLRLVEAVAANVKARLQNWVAADDEVRRRWEIVDLVLAVLVGVMRFGLLSDPRGLDAINHFDCREWLRMNGASEHALDSAFLRALYDLVFAYEGGDPSRPRLAAGDALRGGFRMFFTYRGAFFWKMRRGMGDVVFAPFYQVLRRRGVRFKFFHRLENVRLSGPGPGEGGRHYVQALEFSVQAKVRGDRDYRPVVRVNGQSCWPSSPDYGQLENGAAFEAEGRDFESHWDRRKAATRTLTVTRDFDFVVLGIGLGAIPYVCKEFIARDMRWRKMASSVKTVATQAFQLWLGEDLQQLGWEPPPVTLSAFVKPFDTWSDMGQVVPAEGWRLPPQTIAYFCGALHEPDGGKTVSEDGYCSASREKVRANALAFLDQQVRHLWPKAADAEGGFRWELLVDADDQQAGEETLARRRQRRAPDRTRFDSQFWVANVNPTDRYTQSIPGTAEHRISPLDNTYDNLTVAGDWTSCGLNLGCVEAAVMSGRLAAHALSGSPALEDIVGYDHP
jgi:uncharacterized protein with NAD-binding domain and iron-sulfur cluster